MHMSALEMLQDRLVPEHVEDWQMVRRYIRSDPDIMDGLPTFVGTRVPVSFVLECLADGMTAEAVLEAFPTLEQEHIPAALKFAGLLANIR